VAIPAVAPVVDLDIDINGLVDSVTQSISQLDMDAVADQAAAARLAGEKAREMSDQIRASVADMQGQWNMKALTLEQSAKIKEQTDKIKEMAEKFKDKDWEAQSKAFEKFGTMFAQNVPTPPTPPLPKFTQGGRGPGAAVGIGGGRAIINMRSTNEDRLYESGKNSLDSHRFDDALNAFSELVNRGGSKVEGALYYKAYTLNKLGRRDEALNTIAELHKAYPNSRWMDDAKALEVEVKQAAGKPVSPAEVNDDEIKLLAINGLMQTDPERAFPVLEGLIKGAHSPALKKQAVFVLAQNQSPRAQALLEQIARGATGNPDLQLRALSFFVDTKAKPNRAQLLA
jgi:TolA-binding protein